MWFSLLLVFGVSYAYGAVIAFILCRYYCKGMATFWERFNILDLCYLSICYLGFEDRTLVLIVPVLGRCLQFTPKDTDG